MNHSLGQQAISSPKHCQICFHEVPGHYNNCPVDTQEPVQAMTPAQAFQDAAVRLQKHLAHTTELSNQGNLSLQELIPISGLKSPLSSPLSEAQIDEYFKHVPPAIWNIYDMIAHAVHQTDPHAFETELKKIEAAIRAHAAAHYHAQT